MRCRDLREADRTGCLRYLPLVGRITIAVHENDRDRAQAAGERGPQLVFSPFKVERYEHLAAGADALPHFDHVCIEHLRHDDVPREDVGPVLVADAQRIAETFGHHQQRRFALALEKGIGRDSRAHLHGLDPLTWDRRIVTEA